LPVKIHREESMPRHVRLAASDIEKSLFM